MRIVFAPQGLQDSARRFNAGNIKVKEFALKGVSSAVVTGVKYCMVYPFLWRPYAALPRRGWHRLPACVVRRDALLTPDRRHMLG